MTATLARSTMYQFRIDETEKAETFEILRNMGIKPAQAVRLFFRQIRQTNAIPFPIEHIPNTATAATLTSKDYSKSFDNLDELFAELKT